jgi:hypothetical protein
MKTILLVITTLIALGGAARAQPSTVESKGTARGTGAPARGAAIDQAFAGAVQRALAAMVTPTSRDKVEGQVVRRARSYVSSFQVVAESDRDGQVEVTVRVVVDLDKLKAKLGELGVAVAPQPAAGAPAAASNRPRAVVLLKSTLGGRSETTFGASGGDGGAAGKALADELAGQGFVVDGAVGRPIPTAREGGEGLVPLTDEQAAELGRAAGAGAVLVAGVDVRADGAIRSTKLHGAIARASIRALAGGELVAGAELEAAGFGDDPDAALVAAAREAARDLIRRIGGELLRRWPLERPGDDALAVRVRGHATWAAVGAIIRRLGTTAGVDAVAVRQAGRGAVDLGVRTTLGAQRVASALRGVSLPRGQVAAQPRGQVVDVQITGDAPFEAGVLDGPAPGATPAPGLP